LFFVLFSNDDTEEDADDDDTNNDVVSFSASPNRSSSKHSDASFKISLSFRVCR
jgi:hypothetical protein